MIIKLISTNTNFSYVLDKNPNSGLFVKPLRQGLCIGKFIDNRTYINAFEDGVNEDSFGGENGNYLTYKSYCSVEAALSILITTFDCIKKDKNKEHETHVYLNSIEIFCIDLNNFDASLFSTDYITVTINKIEDSNLVNLTVTNIGSFIDLIRYLCVILFMFSLKGDSYFTWDQVKVYANIINKSDFIPFVVRHRFRGILEDNLAKKAVPLLNNQSIKLSNIGRNEQQRFAFVSQYIKYRNSVLDIGCGPGKYIKVSKATKYIGVDIDTKCIEKAQTKASYLNVEASFYTDWNVALEQLKEPTTVLLIEFIEHIERENAVDLIKLLIANVNVKQILISTPNKDFNKYFNIADDAVRY